MLPIVSPEIRRAITVDARIRPDYTQIRTPVLAIYQAQGPFEHVAERYVIGTDQERARAPDVRRHAGALRAVAAATACCSADDAHRRLPGANVCMFLTHEADVLREVRAFAATLTGR